MAGGGLLLLLDDITSMLDDVALMTKVAATKTAGVVGDDLALNAQQVAGVLADRELPVVWAVAKGSALNKAILVPAALAISAYAPWAVQPLLMAGGAYLCFEGVEKLMHTARHRGRSPAQTEQAPRPLADADPAALERERIKGAIRTDFVLSAEIITITLGTVAGAPLVKQVIVLATVGVLMTIGVYGLVAAIVRMDDMGRRLALGDSPARSARLRRAMGRLLLGATPYLMRTLTVLGTAAMFLVGGGILVHGLPGAHALIEHYGSAPLAAVPVVGSALAAAAQLAAAALTGIVAGAIALAVVAAIRLVLRAK